MQFLKLSNGAIINLAAVVQLTPPGHLQLNSGNVIVLTQADVDLLESEMLDQETPLQRVLRLSRERREDSDLLVDNLGLNEVRIGRTLGPITSQDSAAGQQQPPEEPAPVELEGSARSQPDPAEPGQTPFAPTGS